MPVLSSSQIAGLDSTFIWLFRGHTQKGAQVCLWFALLCLLIVLFSLCCSLQTLPKWTPAKPLSQALILWDTSSLKKDHVLMVTQQSRLQILDSPALLWRSTGRLISLVVPVSPGHRTSSSWVLVSSISLENTHDSIVGWPSISVMWHRAQVQVTKVAMRMLFLTH